VVTKQQMSDFAMIDLNDIFNYEASTEGTGNFTNFSVDRNGMVGDSPMDNPQEANRIRGLTSANVSLNNFALSGRVPVDPINIDAVEISRGPNSNIFGLGQGSGTVNLVAATANFNRSTSVAELRFDDIGGYRASLDLNRPIIRGKLGLRGSVVYQHEEFRQKPSGTTSRRYNAMLRAQPFKNTTLRASFQHYEMYGTRATTITPRDTVSYWKSIGSPSWDPITGTVTRAGVAPVTVTYDANNNIVGGNPLGLGSPTFANPTMFIDQGGIQLWQIQRMPGATATNGPNNTTGRERLFETVAPPVRGAARPLFSTVPGISSREVFDYAHINLAGPNKILDNNDTTTVELEQFFLRSDRQQLALQLGWNREDADRVNYNTVGRSSATGNSGYLYVDVNSRLLDGRPNPFFGRPYLGIGEPVHDSRPYLRDTYRGQGAYILDLTHEKNALRWLGRNQVVGYMEERLTKSYSYRFRDVNLRDHPIYAPAGLPKGNQSGTNAAQTASRVYNRFYVGDNNGQNIDYAPSPIRYGDYPFSWFNPATNQWVTDTGTLGEGAIQEGSAGTFASQNMIKTRGIVLQHSLLQDRVVLTWGRRHDENYNKFQRGSVLQANGYLYDYAAMDGWVPDNNLADGDGHWAKRTGDTKTKGAVVRPFRGWNSFSEMAKRGGAEGFFGQLLSGLGVYYNQSDSFRPETPAITVLQTPLPNPTSLGKDYGFTLNLWDNKLVVRANRYITDQINSRNGEFRTFGDRVMRVDFQGFAGNNDAISLQRQARNWIRAANPNFSAAQVDSAVYGLMKLTADDETIIRAGPLGETQDAKAKGDELEIFFNPDRFWTLKANVTRTRSIDANVAPNIPEWVTQRLPAWEAIIDPRVGTKWLDTGYNGDNPQAGSGTPRQFLQGNIVAPINLARAIQGKNRSQVREWRYNANGSLRLAKYTDNRYLKNVTIGGSLRWEDKATIGYYGIPVGGDIAAATSYDPDRPIYDKAHTYVDAFASYSTRMFKDKVRTRFQLNVRNVQESRAHLQPVGAFPDGTPHTFRVIDPRVWIFTTTFEL
jgi:hypothetical protein